MDITVCIPTIRPRGDLLARAIKSVSVQTYQPRAIAIAYDHEHKGHGLTRNDAIGMAQTEWLAFLDDDDEFYAHHLEHLVRAQKDSGADIVYPAYEVVGGSPVAEHCLFQPWDPEKPHNWPITCLVRKEVLDRVGGFCGYVNFVEGSAEETQWGPGVNPWSGQDWATWKRVIASGAKVYHLPEITWKWDHTSGNTSGQGDRW